MPIQAAIGSRIIARENIRAMRRRSSKCCGDISRKRKLLEKQKEAKEAQKMVGRAWRTLRSLHCGTVFERGEGKEEVAFRCCSFSGCVLTC